jgi:RNA-directed DNA polymerase
LSPAPACTFRDDALDVRFAARENRGWIQYYGAFGLRELYPLLQRINYYLVRWLRKKYRRLRTWKKLLPCWERITSQYPEMFAHWRQVKWYWRTG